MRRHRMIRRAAARPSLGAAGLVLGVVLCLLGPALLGGELLSSTSTLYLFPPWQGEAPPDLASYFNPLLSDIPTAYYPWTVLARDLIREGTFPAWNPYALAGTPFFANPQPGWFSPFSLPLWTLPLNYAFGLVAALKLLAAGFG